ncbi:MAG: AraC family transcriptional regulator [Sphingobium sp.]
MNAKKAPALRVQLMEPYLAILDDRNIPTRNLLSLPGLQEADLTNPLERLPIDAFLTFTHQVAQAIGDPHIGLRLGAMRQPAAGPILSQLFLFAGTLREAIRNFADATASFQEKTQIDLIPHGDDWSVIYRIDDIDPELARQDNEYTLAVLCSLIRSRMGGEWNPIEVHFEHGAPASPAIYERIFRAPVFFDHAISQIVIRKNDLDRINPHAGGKMVDLIIEYLRELRDDMEQSCTVSHRASLAVMNNLVRPGFGIAMIARHLNMSVRSLQRHLANENTSFQEIVRQHRERLARSLMHSGRRTKMADIAATLGYADETTWSRAFKSWTGMSPGRYARTRRTPSTS